MNFLIPSIETLAFQARNVVLPPESEIEGVIRFLADCPVDGYAGFTEDEVRLIAAYRADMNQGTFDQVWNSLADGYREGWAFAVHEAAELQVFADRNCNPFDANQRTKHLGKFHFYATMVELRLLHDWAKQLHLDTTEIALEIANPVRSLYANHANLVRSLQAEKGWPEPTDEELQAAHRFWRLITGETP